VKKAKQSKRSTAWLSKIQAASKKRGTDKLTSKQIDNMIAETRRKNRKATVKN